jgi:hypothetical protein
MNRTLRTLNRISEVLERHVTAPLRCQYWRRRQTALSKWFEDAWTPIDSVGLQDAEARRLTADVQASLDAVIVADVDQDGFLRSYYGPLAGRTCVTNEVYNPRKRLKLSIIATRHGVAVEKHFEGDIRGFVRELRCLIILRAAGCRVPAVLAANFATQTMRIAYVPGRVLRDALAERGARLLDRDLPPLPSMDSLTLRSWRMSEGRQKLKQVVAPTFRSELWRQLRCAHAAGIALCDVKYGNIILDTQDNQPWLIDFELSRCFVWASNPLFAYLKREDFRLLSELCDSPPAPQPAADPKRVDRSPPLRGESGSYGVLP